MRIKRLFLRAMGVLALLTGVGCAAFQDLTPENISFRMNGDSGTPVELVFSTNFVAGVDEVGVTQLRVFTSDTVTTVLPVDTVISVVEDRRFFVQVTPLEDDSITVSVRVQVDGRNLLDESGDIFANSPWRYVYIFNQAVTRAIEVVI